LTIDIWLIRSKNTTIDSGIQVNQHQDCHKMLT